MNALQAYLELPRTKRALSQKPGDKGFSLIELVVVVAVLAILAAIAIPAFNGLQNDAKHSGAKSNLANISKECAYSTARSATGAGTHTVLTDGNGIAYNAAARTAATCNAVATAAVTIGSTVTTYGVNLETGEKQTGAGYTAW